MPRLLPLALALLALLTSTCSAQSGYTNQCLQLLGGLQVCPTSIALPSSTCCDALNAFNKAGCFYNPVMTTLAGQTAINQLKYLLKPICVLKAPLKWLYWVNPNNFNKHTYNAGTCPLADADLDNARISSSLGFAGVLNQYSQIRPSPDTCFDYNTFEGTLAQFLSANPSGTVGYGIGTYHGLRNLAEYLALYLPSINLELWLPFNDLSGAGAIIYVTPDGSSVITGGTGYSKFFNGCYNTGTLYAETVQTFNGCGTTIDDIYIGDTSLVTGQPTGLATLVSMYYIGQSFDVFGNPQICKFHSDWCAGTPNQQYASEQACLDFLNALPVVASAGPTAIFAGNSTTCRFKHVRMAPIQPDAHCFHIGPGRADVNGVVKCSDAELSNVLAYSNPAYLQLTPNPAIQACIAASNAAARAPGFVFPKTKLCPGTYPGSSGRRLEMEHKMDEVKARVASLRGAA